MFDTRRFETLIEEERQAYQFFFIGLGVAHYYKNDKALPPHFEELATPARDVITQALAGPDFPVDDLLLPFVKRRDHDQAPGVRGGARSPAHRDAGVTAWR